MPERVPRFLTIPQVAEELATTEAQVIGLLKRGDLPAIKLGGRGQWRIERSKLEDFIAQAYADTERELRARRAAGEGLSADEDYRQEEGGEG